MKFLPFLLCLALLPLQAVVTQAQPQTAANTSTKKLDELITTLESKTARTELIDQLKTLRNAQQQGGNGENKLVSWLNIDEHSSYLTKTIAGHLDGLDNVDKGMVQYSVVAVAIFLLVVWFFLNKALVRFSTRHIKDLRRRFRLAGNRFDLLLRLQHLFGNLFGIIIFIYSVDQVMELTETGILFGWSFTDAFTKCFTLMMILALFAAIWEISNASIEFSLHRTQYTNSNRIQTLLPLVRNVMLVILTVLSAMVVLSELGIDIMPLLAGAGVLGIAIGFGAQTLVKDFLTGITVILEDLLQIGDVVQVGNRLGAVERITLRKIQLRDLEGIVHTVPFGEISIVDNYTKEYSYYLFDVGVAYKEDTDTVIEILNAVDEEMRASSEYKAMILEPLETLGVDQFADSAVVIKARIKTVAHDRWTVGREYKRRIKYAFDDKGIEIPFPHQTVYFGDSLLQVAEGRTKSGTEKNSNREQSAQENTS